MWLICLSFSNSSSLANTAAAMRSRKNKKPRLGAAGRRSSGATSAAAAAAAAVSKPRSLEHDTSATSLYGLYSTSYSDYCSGSWFPIQYTGPAPPASSVQEDPDAEEAAVPPRDDDILVRWHSETSFYDPERLALAFVRHGAEFLPLSIAHQKIGKRVLVRDLLQDMDFDGVSFWLATITAEPTLPAQTNGKKRAAGVPMVAVEYQNAMWPATSVPCTSIFVLPKLKAPLNLVTEVETEELKEKRRKWKEQQEMRDRLLAAEEENQGSSAAAAAAAAGAAPSTAAAVPSVSADDLTAAPNATGSPRPFAFSLPSGGVDLDLQPLDEEVAAASAAAAAASRAAQQQQQQQQQQHANNNNAQHLTDSDHD